jgi:hypothetical protein
LPVANAQLPAKPKKSREDRKRETQFKIGGQNEK